MSLYDCPLCNCTGFVGSYRLAEHLKRCHNGFTLPIQDLRLDTGMLTFSAGQEAKIIGYRVRCWCNMYYRTMADFAKHLSRVEGGPSGHLLKHLLGATP